MASSSSILKRKQVAGASPTGVGKRPRIELEALSTTHRVWQEITSRYDLEIPVEQFTMLCAYLCTILQWGYQIDAADMDGFIRQYPEFERCSAQFEALQTRENDPCIPAFHQWYLQHQQNDGTVVENTLTEENLRTIWSENPYTFLRAQHRLRRIAQQNREFRARNKQSQDLDLGTRLH